MADDDHLPPQIRLVNFVSEEQLEEARRSRGSRIDDGTAQRDRSLYEILKENKDRKDAEFNERFKHRPPKALDEDETEFLDKLEMSRREYERQVADEEALQLQRFQAAVAAQCDVHELKETPSAPKVQDQNVSKRKNPSSQPLGMVIKVKPQAKKAKGDLMGSEETSIAVETPGGDKAETHNSDNEKFHFARNSGLVSYSESDEDE
ncbi:PSME3-interacting protein [Coffea eugenioides]|uniref:PSME3-interacting protein n=1 Tax=Coffea eugenioides TaxID=49369 RepID=UPI000F5C820B|nr:PSME3-interacting protein-like isoform X1 [Coffea arabica]XP_027152315.1 PSME3-interacting protein [Coffea eugenioides]